MVQWPHRRLGWYEAYFFTIRMKDVFVANGAHSFWYNANMITAYVGYQERAYLRRNGHQALDEAFRECAWLYNAALEHWQAAWKHGHSGSLYEQCRELTAIRHDDAYWGGGLVVVDETEVDDELVRDMTEIMTSFCARLYDRRSARNRARRALEAAGDDARIPDLLFVRDGNRELMEEQRGYAIDRQGKAPDFVLEVASPTTGRVNYTDKRLDYERFGVAEYWRFDPSGEEYHDAAFAGDLLFDGVYEPIAIEALSEGHLRGYSDALGLYVCWEDGMLRFFDSGAESYLDTHEEERAGRLTAQARAREEEAARMAAQARAEEERTGRLAAEARMTELEEELRRLRGE